MQELIESVIFWVLALKRDLGNTWRKHYDSIVKGGELMPRRFWFLAILCVFFVCLQGLVSASSPQDDWTYSAIAELARGRGIPGFEVSARLNRNQGALLVSRLLQHIGGDDGMQSRRFGVSQNVYLDSMIFSYNQRVGPEQAFTASEVELLYRLVLEYAEELEILGYAIQDFKLLYAQNFADTRVEGLFAERKLLYSEQVLAAARKNAEQSSVAFESTDEATSTKAVIAQIVPEPMSPRNLWTGQFSAPGLLPSSSSFSMLEPVSEENSVIQIGNVEVSGSLRPGSTSSSSFESTDSTSADSDSMTGYGISMRIGDLALETAVDLSVDRELLVPKTTSTSVGLSWDWSDLFTLNAGVSRRESVGDEDEDKPLVTSLGVVVPINRGQVHLGMTQEWNSPNVGGNSLPSEEVNMSASAAELGLTYDFKNDSSLRFNYRFIDFSNMEPGTEAEAAFSIKF